MDGQLLLTGMQGRWWANPFPDAVVVFPQGHQPNCNKHGYKDDFPTD